MKRLKGILVVLTAVLFVVIPLSASSRAVFKDVIEQVHTLVPRLSDGVSITADDGSNEILSHIEGDELVFDETKQLSFTVTYSDGWLVCNKYSNFFPNDSRASRTQTDDDTVEYTFSAVTGESVSLEEWESVTVYASASELPKLEIDIDMDFADVDRETWVDASFSITLGTKQFESGDYEGTGTVKGRGNSSWTYPKKPYSIKLEKKASLLDIPKTKKYAIIPSYYDGSLMRNYITYKGWQELYGIDYVTKCEFVDVYLNGVYNGIYILCERIDIEKSKVDIEEADADNMTGGYLIEKDVNGRIDFNEDLWFNCPYWANQAKDYFVLKSPEPDDTALADAMRAYLESYMQDVHASIMGESDRPYTDYVDTSSWVDFIIVQEIAKNIDGPMKTSCWLYKDRDDDHIYMTAPWDFDFAYGLVSWNNQSEEHNDVYDCPPANTPEDFMIVNSSNPWMDTLYDTVPDFQYAVKLRYTLYRHTLIDGMFDMIDEQAAYLNAAAPANQALWGRNFSTGVRNLKSWLTNRIEWLDSVWLLDTVPEQGDVNLDGEINSYDALMVMRHALGIRPLDDFGIVFADVNGDGEVDSLDALLILRISLGIRWN